MKIQHTIILLLLGLLIIVLQFSFCAPPTRPDFPPRLLNDKYLRTGETPELGQKFVMYIEAEGDYPLTYKWYRDDVVIEGANNDSFVIDSLISEDEGVYKCKVTAKSASVFSNPYKLQIKRDNQEVLLENNGMVFSSGKPKLNKPFVLYIKPANNLQLTYQWYKDFELIKQATNDTLLFWNISNTDHGSFFCKVNHNYQTERSLYYILEIGNNSPVWNNDKMSVTINAGATLQLSLKDSCNDEDNDTLSFTLMPGKPDNDLVNNSIYEFRSNPDDRGEYNVSIKASNGNVESIGTIQIIINQENKPPEFKDSLPHASYQLNEGGNLTIKFEAIDVNNDEVTYMLSENTLPRPETTVFDTKSKTLTWVSRQGDKGKYKIMIEASDGKTTTKKAVDIGIGKVNLPPSISISDVNPDDTVDILESKTLQFTVKISDPNTEDKPTFNEPENMPKGASFDKSTGIFSYTPEYGVSSESINKTFHTITFHATDNAVESPLQAKFVFHITVQDKKFKINATSAPGGSIDPIGTIKVEPGDSCRFIFTPKVNCKINRVLVNGNDLGTVNSYTFRNIEQNNTIRAIFEEKTYSLEIFSDAYGIMDPEGSIWVKPDTSIMITVDYSKPDYRFEEWEILQGNPEIKKLSIDTFEVRITDEITIIKAWFAKKLLLFSKN